jgi:hypothetical protein
MRHDQLDAARFASRTFPREMIRHGERSATLGTGELDHGSGSNSKHQVPNLKQISNPKEEYSKQLGGMQAQITNLRFPI